MKQSSLISSTTKENSIKKSSDFLPKTKFISSLKNGDHLENEPFVCKNVRLGITAGGKNYLDLILADKTGEINAKIWHDNLLNCPVPKADDTVAVYATIEEFKDKPQLNISAMQKNVKIDITEFLPTTKKSFDELIDFIEKKIDSIKDKNLKKLLSLIFADQNFKQKFYQAPAAEFIHHAYLGGLLEHIQEMLLLAETCQKLYPDLDMDLLNSGILLHDIGKVEELAVGNSINRTLAGNLVGHLILGTTFVDQKICAIKDFPQNLRAKILNMLISHHERPEFGSPVRPMTFEAVALTYIDNLSAKLNSCHKVLLDNQNSEMDFSDKNFALDAKIYLK